MPHAGDEPADGVLRPPGAPAGPLSAGRRCRGPSADPRGDQQPGHLWLPSRVGHGESDLSHRLHRKRIRRVMQLHGLMLPPRVHRRHGRPHLGQIQRPASNQRWCSDVFLIPCWSGEVLSVAFAIDCHDREVLAYLASPRSLTGAYIRTLMDRALWARFGEATLTAPHAIQWVSDNGPQDTATATVLYAHELGLVPLTTPAYSPQSNGLAEAFVKTVKRDYVDGAELRDAESVLAQLSGWIEDYNARAPHSALGMRSPVDYRAAT